MVLAVALTAAFTPPAAGAANRTILVSRPDGRGPVPAASDNNSKPGAVSSDGRYVAFASDADGFAPGVNPLVRNVFVRDTRLNTTVLVSRSDGVGGAGVNRDAEDPVIAVGSDGHILVAFTTAATNLSDHTAGPVGNAEHRSQVWLRDVTAGTTVLISQVGTSGVPGNDDSVEPSIDVSAGGPLVAFRTFADNLVAGGSGVLLRTVDAGTTELVACRNRDCGANAEGASAFNPSVRVVAASAGTLCVAPSSQCVMVAFDTGDPTVTGSTAPHDQIVVAIANAPTTPGAGPSAFFRFSTVTAGDDGSDQPALDSDGRAVAFISNASNLTADPVPTNIDEAYVASLDGGGTQLVSKAQNGAADAAVFSVALGGDESHLRAVFDTGSSNMGAPSTARSQVYMRDLHAGTTTIISRAAGPGGAVSNFGSFGPVAISADGSAAVFESFSTNLGDDPTGDGFARVQLRRLTTPGQEDVLASRPSGTGAFGSPTSGNQSEFGRAVSANGRYAVFESASAGLTATPYKPGFHVFVRDLVTGRTILADRANGPAGAAADGNSNDSAISADGRKVIFDSSAGGLTRESVAGRFEVYVRDLVANTTTLVSRANGMQGAPAAEDSFAQAISADGNSALIESSSPLDQAGDGGHFHIYVRDLARGTTTLVDRDDGANGASATSSPQDGAIDANGGKVAWATDAALAGAPADGNTHVYVRDLHAGTTTLVSRADGADGASANGNSFRPSIDAAGDAVAFTSEAANLGLHVDQQTGIFVRSGDHTVEASLPLPGGSIVANSDQPSIDAAGDRVAFEAPLPPDGTDEVLVRDLAAQVTSIASLADGSAATPADGPSVAPSISGNGQCVTFAAQASNLGDGFASPDFGAVYLRPLGPGCPPAVMTPPPPPAPVLSALKLSSRRLKAGSALSVSFALSRAARVSIQLARIAHGRARIVRSIGISARAGVNRVRVSLRARGNRLARGRYRLIVTPSGGHSAQVSFVVIARQGRRR
jgi:Tol biopolymer transport system component